MNDYLKLILGEIHEVFLSSSYTSEALLLEQIVSADTIVCAGAGRVGLAVAGFAKRLRHLGKNAFWIGDATVPATGPGDLLLLASGSGETRTVLAYAEVAKLKGISIALLTATERSSMTALADVKVTLNCPSKGQLDNQNASSQPMTTLFEQACMVYFDSLVLQLVRELGTSHEEMASRHNVIE